MKIEKDYDLSKLNTFSVPAKTKYFALITNEEEIKELFSTEEFKNSPKIFLGGGSNVLMTRDWEGIAVHNKLTGIEIIEEGEEYALVRAMGGEIWHNLVEFAVGRELWGIENLSLIPGSVGAAPMQNIGAYGAELKETLEEVEAYDLSTGEKRVFSKDECNLGYRDSVFKNELRGKYFISAVTLKLLKKGTANLSYKILREYLENNKIKVKGPKASPVAELRPRDIADAVANIRRSKLPDPKILGNAGSFFKNVFVTKEELESLQTKYPDISFFEEDESIKIPAGWLIERMGWKGKRLGNVGVHERQALVLVNYGGATGSEVLDLAQKIIASVKDEFGLTLVPEVNIV